MIEPISSGEKDADVDEKHALTTNDTLYLSTYVSKSAISDVVELYISRRRTMIKHFCERCEAHIEHWNDLQFTLNIVKTGKSPYSHKALELCSSCVYKFMKDGLANDFFPMCELE